MKKILELLKKINKTIKPEELKPFENEHACRLEDPGNFTRFRRQNNAAQSNGKRLDFIFGILKGKSKLQAIRYPKDEWSAEAAKKHCSTRGGSFEAAKK